VKVQLAGQLGAERMPVALEEETDVVGFPSFGDSGPDVARGAIPQSKRLAVWSARTEHRFEGAELATAAHDVLHVGERLVVEEHLPRFSGERPRLAGVVREQALVRIDVDALEVTEVDGVRRRRPRASEEVGMSHLQPQTAPTA